MADFPEDLSELDPNPVTFAGDSRDDDGLYVDNLYRDGSQIDADALPDSESLAPAKPEPPTRLVAATAFLSGASGAYGFLLNDERRKSLQIRAVTMPATGNLIVGGAPNLSESWAYTLSQGEELTLTGYTGPVYVALTDPAATATITYIGVTS